jgi:excisionase family DNA binding protein
MSAQTHSPENVLYDTEEAADLLKSSRRTLEYWRGQGNGPRFVKLGRRVRYRRAALDAFLSQQERSHTREEK